MRIASKYPTWVLTVLLALPACQNVPGSGSGQGALGGGPDAADSDAPVPGCTPAALCSDPTPCREAQSGQCVQCLPWEDHCLGGTWCSASFQCITACQTAADCYVANGGAPLSCCGGQCVDVQLDPVNCGACGASCAGDCVNGACVVPPDAGAPDMRAAAPCGAGVTACASGLGGVPVVPIQSQSDYVSAAGDLDGDGQPDLIVVDSYNGFLGVMRNLGGGVFGPRVDYPVGDRPRAVALADLDDDGLVDVIVANYYGGNVNILYGVGGGVLGEEELLPTAAMSGGHASAVAIADLDGDGLLDLAVTDDTTTALALFPNNGGRHLGMPITLTAGHAPAGIAIADFDGDHHLDIATANGNGTAELSVFLNQGGWTYAAANSAIPGGTYATSLAAGDVNGDGAPDLVVGTNQCCQINFFVVTNKGNGTFNVPVSYGGTGNSTQSLVVGDVDADGKLDVVAAAGTSLYVYRNQGAGVFSAMNVPSYSDAGYASSVVLADFDGDGRPDLAAHNDAGEVLLFFNLGGGSYSTMRTFSITASYSPLSMAVGDFDKDGKNDVLFIDNYGHGAGLMRNQGGGALAAPVFYAVDAGPVAVGDLNGDGFLDVVVASSSLNVVEVLTNRGNGTFTAKSSYATGSQPYWVAIADLDGDGKPDLATANYNAGTVSVLLNRGGGTFGASVDYPAGRSPYAIAAADLDGDGRVDLAVVGYSEQMMHVLPNQGGGAFGLRSYPDPYSPQSIAIVDLDGDGRPDVVAGGGGNVLSVYQNRGGGILASRVDYPAGRSAGGKPLLVGDMNGDCLPDLVSASSVVEVQFNLGGGALGGFVDFALPGVSAGAIADLDGDGRLDIVGSTNQPTNAVVVLPQVCF